MRQLVFQLKIIEKPQNLCKILGYFCIIPINKGFNYFLIHYFSKKNEKKMFFLFILRIIRLKSENLAPAHEQLIKQNVQGLIVE